VTERLDVMAAAGELLPPTKVPTEPAVPADEAASTAAVVVARAQAVNSSGVTTTPPTLAVYDPALLGGRGVPGARLVWQTEATGEGGTDPFREIVLVDAQTGGLVLHFDQIAHGRDRQICDDNNIRSAAENCWTSGPVIRTEGGPATGLTDADAAYEFSGDTYDFYFDRFGRDSLNDAGMTLYSETRFCYTGPDACPYDNAFWNGHQMTYGQGFALADDVVGHELTHGVTEFTSNLFYYYQSGAINESMSDVFGELIDLTNGAGDDSAGVRWLLGEDIPGIGAIRDMADPTVFGAPDKMTSANYWDLPDDNGGVHTNSGVNNKAASLLVDGGSFNGHTVTALGIDKVAAIYYEVETGLLQSGSDYGDLYDMLPQACNNLVGGAEGITAGDCVEVTDAVDATEMNLEPPALANPDAPLCGAGETKTDLLTDAIAELAPGWTATTTAGQGWVYTTGFAHSDPYSLWDEDDAEVTDASIRRTDAIAVPSSVSTYLLFNHANEFEDGSWDGGVVEYSTSGGAGPWLDAGPLFDHSGYSGTIGTGFSNPLSGRAAFVDASGGYRQSRVVLTSLAGQNVHLRFRTGTDSSVGAMGWLLDDLTVFTCAAAVDPPPSVTVTAPADAATVRGPVTLTATSADTDLTGIEFFVDSVSVGVDSDGTDGWSLRWNSAGTGDGLVHPITATATDAIAQTGSDSVSVTVLSNAVADFDGLGESEIGIYRPSTGRWWIYGQVSPSFGGVAGDIPVPADYDGNGTTDIAIYRPSTGRWYVRNGFSPSFGGAEGDIPVPADYDGDGDDDIAIYRPSTGRWWIYGQVSPSFGGLTGDIPVPADYDGNGTTDIAIYRPSTGRWYVRNGFSPSFGGAEGDIPLTARIAS
jgi:Zn-dependent metalloprotease